jgi:hypothetical protein
MLSGLLDDVETIALQVGVRFYQQLECFVEEVLVRDIDGDALPRVRGTSRSARSP